MSRDVLVSVRLVMCKEIERESERQLDCNRDDPGLEQQSLKAIVVVVNLLDSIRLR